MALPASDSFTGTSGTALATYSANWTQNVGEFRIQTNALAVYSASSSDDSLAHWSADTFDNDQYAAITKTVAVNYVSIGIAVRVGTGTNYTGYTLESASTESYVGVCYGGTWTQLGSTGPNVTVGQEMLLEANGTTITPYFNGSIVSAIGAQTHSAISSGYAGVYGYGRDTGIRGDNWRGGNLALPEITGNASITLGAATLSATGTVAVTGAAAITLGTLTASAAGTVSVTGNASITLGAAALSATGTVTTPEATGDADITLDALTLSATGAVDVTGSTDATLDALTAASTGTVDVSGAADTTLDALTLASAAAVDVIGQADATLGTLTVLATGTVAVSADADISLDALSLSASGAVDVTANASITLDALTMEGAGIVGNPPAIADADITLDALTLSAAGAVDISGAADITLDALTVESTGAVDVSGDADITLGGLSLSADGAISSTEITATADITLEDVTLIATGAVTGDGDVTYTTLAAAVDDEPYWTVTVHSAANYVTTSTDASLYTVIVRDDPQR